MKRVRGGTIEDVVKEFNGILKKRVIMGGPEIIVAFIYLGMIIAGGYFATQAITAWNKPAVESVKSTSPLNEGLGVLFADIGAHWMETIVLVMGAIVLISYIRKSRNNNATTQVKTTKRRKDEGIGLVLAAFLIIMAFMFFFFIQNYTLVLCANWFPITMIILALAVFFYLKNKSEGGKK